MNSNMAGVLGANLELDWCMIYLCTFPISGDGKIILLMVYNKNYVIK